MPITQIKKPILYLLSLRNISPFPAQGCVLELEDVFSEVTGALIISPETDHDIVNFRNQALLQNANLFIPAISFEEACQILRKIKSWRNIFGKVFFYIFDAFLSESEKNKKSNFRKRLSRFTSTISKIDHIFIPILGEVNEISMHYNVPVSYIPMGSDVKKFGSSQNNRNIDINAYGRQNTIHVNILSDIYNNKESGRALYYTSHMSIGKLNDIYQHRAFFWKMLSISRIALAYDPIQVNPGKRHFPCSFVGQRWFESLAAGCVVVGYRPVCQEANELLSWEDATIECPKDPVAFVEFIEKLLCDSERLKRARLRNYLNMLLMHDWSYRIENIMKKIGLSLDTEKLIQRQEELTRLSTEARKNLYSIHKLEKINNINDVN